MMFLGRGLEVFRRYHGEFRADARVGSPKRLGKGDAVSLQESCSRRGAGYQAVALRRLQAQRARHQGITTARGRPVLEPVRSRRPNYRFVIRSYRPFCSQHRPHHPPRDCSLHFNLCPPLEQRGNLLGAADILGGAKEVKPLKRKERSKAGAERLRSAGFFRM